MITPQRIRGLIELQKLKIEVLTGNHLVMAGDTEQLEILKLALRSAERPEYSCRCYTCEQHEMMVNNEVAISEGGKNES